MQVALVCAELAESVQTFVIIIPLEDAPLPGSAEEVVEMVIPTGVRIKELRTARELMSTPAPLEPVDCPESYLLRA